MSSLRTLAGLHLLANAFLLWLGYYWLGVGESRASTLAWSALVAAVIVGLGCWAYGSVLVYFQSEEDRRAIAAWRSTVRNLLPLALLALAVVVVYFLLARWADYSSTPASTVASYLTLKIRKPVRPAAVLRVFNVALWLVRWVAIPVLLLPILSAIASRGWSGYRAWGTLHRTWLYWIEVPVLLVCALWVPLKLLGWVPGVNGFSTEMASFVLRAGIAYLLLVTAWLLLAFVTSAGKPRFTQPKTLASP
jgi:hypothetical protein